MINKLVVENLRHRPIRTLLSVFAIAIQVTMVLTLVGLSNGMLNDQARRARGVGADILVRAPSSSVITMSGGMPARIADRIEQQPHVIGRARFGNITVANSDAGRAAYTDSAIDQAYRQSQPVALLIGRSPAP